MSFLSFLLLRLQDKRFSELQATAEEIKNKVKISDFLSLQTLFEKLNKQLDKTLRATEGDAVPRVYLRTLALLGDSLEATALNKDAKKKLSPTNAKAFNGLRQKVKKHIVGYAAAVEAIRGKMETTSEEESASDDDSDSDGDDGGDDGQEDGSGDENEVPLKGLPGDAPKKDKFWSSDPAEVTWDQVDKKLSELVVSRGRKGTDRKEAVEQLGFLVRCAKGPAQQVGATMQQVSAMFDLNPSMSSHMTSALWHRAACALLRVFGTLKAHPYVTVREDADPEARADPASLAPNAPQAVAGNMVAFVERLDDEYFKSLQCIDPHTTGYVERMQAEPLFLILAQELCAVLDAQGEAAAAARIRLRRLEHIYYKPDAVYTSLLRAFDAQQRRAADDAAGSLAAAAAAAAADDADFDVDGADAKDDLAHSAAATDAELRPLVVGYAFECGHSVVDSLRQLTRHVYASGDERAKARCLLCNVYALALSDAFYRARDLLLMSHLQENVQHMDISTQILFNRTMAQLGLAAFRAGLVAEAHGCLLELYQGGRVKELLAQGIALSRYHDKTPEQEKLERRRQMPFHMHINLELLECCYLISAMLLEVPTMNVAAHEVRRAKASRQPFWRLVQNYEHQPFTGPPESVRDTVMAATQALLKGNWQAAVDSLTALPVWGLVPQRERVLASLRTRIKEEGLRTYLFTCAAHYSSLSLGQLAEMFELDTVAVHGLVSKMIASEELRGSHDQPSSCVVMFEQEPSRLQQLAATFADKASVLVDANERAMEALLGDASGADGPYAGGMSMGGDRGGGAGPRRDRQQMGGRGGGGGGWDGDRGGGRPRTGGRGGPREDGGGRGGGGGRGRGGGGGGGGYGRGPGGGGGGGFGGGGNWGGDGDTFGLERYASFGGKARDRPGGGRYLDTTTSVSGYTREPVERRGDPRFRTQRKDERAERMVSLLGGRGEAADWRK